MDIRMFFIAIVFLSAIPSKIRFATRSPRNAHEHEHSARITEKSRLGSNRKTRNNVTNISKVFRKKEECGGPDTLGKAVDERGNRPKTRM